MSRQPTGEARVQPLSPTNKRAFRLVAAAVLPATLLWVWWVAHDTPQIHPRPHFVMWDIVSAARQAAGQAVPPPINITPEHWMSRWGAAMLRVFGEHFPVLVAAQLPFLWLLILAAAALAWNLGGPDAAVFTAFATALGPMTVGLATQFDDLLALQALVVVALAALAWIGPGRRLPLVVVPAIALALLGTLAIWFSNSLLAFGVFGAAAVALLLGRVFPRPDAASRRHFDPLVLVTALAAVLAVGVGIWIVTPFPAQYLADMAEDDRFLRYSVWHNLDMIWAGPTAWWSVFAGPMLACLALAAAVTLAIRRRFAVLAFGLGWLLLPMVALTLINKRHDFYLVTAVPATYILVGCALAALGRFGFRRHLIAAVAGLLAASWIAQVGLPINEKATDRLRVLFEGSPMPYLVSPTRKPLYDFGRIARVAVSACDGAQRLVFVSPNIPEAPILFHAWAMAPKLPLGHVFAGPVPPAERRCLLVEFFEEDQPPYTFDGGLAVFRREAARQDAFTPEVEARLREVASRQPYLRYVDRYTGWVAYADDGD